MCVILLQLSVHGDLFCQNYQAVNSTRIADKTLSAGPGSGDIKLADDDLKHCKQWISELMEQVRRAEGTNPELEASLDASTVIYGEYRKSNNML